MVLYDLEITFITSKQENLEREKYTANDFSAHNYCVYYFYHFFGCNIFVFECPIIAKSQCWLFALRANICICPRIQLPVFAS